MKLRFAGVTPLEKQSVLSIIDVKDFIDLDKETVNAVHQTFGLPADETIALAQQLLSTESGLITLHHMFRDLIADAEANFQSFRENELRQAYAHFARKYPLPHIL
ncbi:MAG: hypothetical protein IPJ38_11885 [Dechloromonas sp.]|uniref:Uncharacterized protein n=1 Tax=Candidatus Dechloromonas phosphorivorans TaxID=2899244 RepID=A0A935MWD4_9RHOO|nr:hypothetical protein [Candidatus Dechloromonas phosphorivorans]